MGKDNCGRGRPVAWASNCGSEQALPRVNIKKERGSRKLTLMGTAVVRDLCDRVSCRGG